MPPIQPQQPGQPDNNNQQQDLYPQYNPPQPQPPQQPMAGSGGIPPTAASMYDPSGGNKKSISPLLISLIIAGVLLIISIGFGLWAFSGRQTYKNQTEEIVASEVESARDQLTKEKEAEFLEREKEPLKEYKGPEAFGNVTVLYPKTWSAHVDESGGGKTPVKGYFHPNFVPGIRSGISFGLRVEVIEDDITRVLRTYDSAARSNKVRISPIDAENVTGVSGSRIEGEVVKDKKGIAVVFPLRDKTLLVMTESEQYQNDFDNIILKNLRFDP